MRNGSDLNEKTFLKKTPHIEIQALTRISGKSFIVALPPQFSGKSFSNVLREMLLLSNNSLWRS